MPPHAHHYPEIININIGINVLWLSCMHICTSPFSRRVDVAIPGLFFLSTAFKSGTKNFFCEEKVQQSFCGLIDVSSTYLYKEGKNEEDNTLNKHVDES